VLHRGYTSYYKNRGSARPAGTSIKRLCGNDPLVLTTALLRSDSGVGVVIDLVAVVVTVALVLGGRNPEAGLSVVEGLVLAGQVNTVLTTASGIAATLGKSAGARGKLGGDGGVLGNPVGEGILAVLDDTTDR
jgi:hypothetical protein